jgi:dihydropyrimidinase
MEDYMLQLLIKNGICVNPSGEFLADIAVSEEKIVHIGRAITEKAERVVDVGGHYVLPGIIDAHVHLPWPSSAFDSVDDYTSGSIAAMCGGVTTIIEFVVPDESGRILPALEKQMASAEDASYVDFSFHPILRKITPQTLKDMETSVKRGITSFKIYTAYSGFQLGDEDILTILRKSKDLGALICFHAEDGVIVDTAIELLAQNKKTDIQYYPEAHPASADVSATHRIITYAKYLGARIHIVHVNTGAGASMIGEAHRAGWPITGETCPQYLVFTDDVYRTGKPEAHYFVLAPCIRTESDRLLLWRAINSNDLQMIATDHCPYTSAQKLENVGDFRKIPGGAGGIETSLPMLYTYGVEQGRLSLPRLVEIVSTNPAKIFNLFPRKGIIAVGSDADLVILNPNSETQIHAGDLHSNTDHTIYEGLDVKGKVGQTILRGEVVSVDGNPVIEIPSGRFLSREPYEATSL